jgi:hypothetical protein
VQIEFASDLSAWQDAFAQGIRGIDSLDSANEEIGDQLVEEARNNFESQGGALNRWEPLKEATLQRKIREGWPTAPLIRTGDLYRSIRKLEVTADHVDVGSDLEYARPVFFGTRPGVYPVLPQRSPFVFAPALIERFGALYLNHIWARRLH